MLLLLTMLGPCLVLHQELNFVIEVGARRSEAQVGQARARWAALREQADTQMRYFAQDDAGKWEQRA